MAYFKLHSHKALALAASINEAFMAEYIVANPNDNVTKKYLEADIVLGFGYIIKNSYTVQFIIEEDILDTVEALPNILPVYFSDFETEFDISSAILIVNKQIIHSLPKAKIQVVGGTEQQLLEYVFSEDFDLSGLKPWSELVGAFIEKGVWCVYGGKPYISTNPHTVQAVWKPDISVSLWVTRWPDGVIGPWRQPNGAHDAYKLGMKVRHTGWIWEVTETDANGNNVWEPGVFGWRQIEQIETPEPPDDPCASILVWDKDYPYWEYQLNELRKGEVNGVWKVYKGINTGQMHNDPAGPYGHLGWEYQYDCPST